MELVWELQMDVEYGTLTLEENTMLSALVLAATWDVETHSLQRTLIATM